MWFWMTPYHPVTWHGACALPILPLKWPINIALIHYSAIDQARRIKFGSKYGYNHKRWICVDIHLFNVSGSKGAWPRVTRPNFEILGPLNNFWTKKAIRFKFDTDIENGPSLRTHHKRIPKWAWPGSSDLILKFWDPLNNCWMNSYPLKIWYGDGGRTLHA